MSALRERREGRLRRTEIVRAARRLLTSGGPQALTLRRVAAAVGIKMASLQYHFPAKSDLIEALVQDVVQRYAANWRNTVENDTGEHGRRLASIVRYLATDALKPQTARLFTGLWTLGAHQPRVRSSLTWLYDQYRAGIASCITELRPDLDETGCLRTAATIVSLVEGATVVSHFEEVDAVRLTPEAIVQAALGVTGLAGERDPALRGR